MTLPRSLSELVEQRADDAPDRRALVFDDGALTYAELAELSQQAASVLRAHGVRRGDRVALMVGNTLDVPVALLGAARLGALLVPLHPEHRSTVLHHMTSLTEPAVLVVDADLADGSQLATLHAAAPGVPVIDAAPGSSAFLAAVRAASADGCAPAEDGPVSIMFTSGTTGRSKGVVLDQRFYLTEGDAYRRVAEITDHDVLGTVLPLTHANAQCASLIGALLTGVPLVCWRRFSARRFWSDLAAAGVTVVNLLGAMAPILLKTFPDPVHGHGVRLAVGGAVPPASAIEFRKRFGVDTREVYGLTEVGIACGERRGSRRLGSAGRPLARWSFRIAQGDAAGGRPGEIQIRAQDPSAMFREYWRDPQRTRDAFTDDGWFRTGDRGRLDADGFLHFEGRIKDSIRRRGENISADEIEEIVNRHPGVAESVALAVPSELAEDEVKLVYVPVSGTELTPTELHAFCVREMASFMVPRFIERRDALPRTSTLKVIRAELASTLPPVVDVARQEG